MTGATTGGGENAPGREGSPAGDAQEGDAESSESGYRRDDYWREASRDDVEPGSEPEPDQGFGFESTQEKARSGDGGPDAGGPDAAEGQGGAGERDEARIVDD